MRKGTRIALAVSMVASLVALGVTAGWAGPSGTPGEIKVSTARLVVVPMSGPVKTKVKIYGAGFIPGEKVRVSLDIEGITIVFGAKETGGLVEANETGAFVLKPRGGISYVINPGVYTVKAVGDKGSVAFTPLEVLGKK